MITCRCNCALEIPTASRITDLKCSFTRTRTTEHVKSAFLCVSTGISKSLSLTYFINTGWFVAGHSWIAKSTYVVVGFRVVMWYGCVAIAVVLYCRFTITIFTWFDVVCIVLIAYALICRHWYVIRSTLIITTRVMPKSRLSLNIRNKANRLYLWD